jgi:DNA primase
MRFGPDILDDIRARLPVSQVVARRVRLKRQGREHVGLSPFNQEKSPSFFVNDQKGFYHDFSSGKHGDIFTFLMETEGLSFPEAVERLAEEAGVRLPARDATPEVREAAQRRAGAAEALEIAAAFFEAELKGPGGAAARAYLAKRGLSPATIAEFRLGLAPASRTALRDHLRAKNVPAEAALEAGLLIGPDDGGAPYDRFRDRVIIPIHDLRGRVVGFGGRALDPEAKPKYLNSPETPLFRKSELLFNGHRAREAAHKESRLVLVEGYMDAIALWQAGFKPVVAALGTAFNEAHVQNLWKLAPEPVICFDGDRAGLGAAHRAVDRVLPELKEGRSFWFAFLPDGEDPDDFVRRRGLDAFNALVAAARPLSDVLWDREVGRWPVNTPERMAGFEGRIREAVQAVKDRGVARRYELHFRVRLASFFYRLEREKVGRRPDAAPARPREIDTARPAVERTLLGLCVERPELFEENVERIMPLPLTGALDAFKTELYRVLVEFQPLAAVDFYKRIKPEFFLLLDLVHGEDAPEKGRQRGWRVRELLPILRYHPPAEFVARTLDLFIDLVELRHVEADRDEANARLAESMEPAAETRLFALLREAQTLADRIKAREAALDEEARGYRQAGRAASAA